MSRIGKLPVAVPSGVDVKISNGTIQIKGPKGELTQGIPQGISVEHNDGAITVTRSSDLRNIRALHGLIRSLISNMVHGVTEGFSKSLEVIGVGYSAQVKGKDLQLNVGFTTPVMLPIPEGLEVAPPSTTNIAIPGVGSVPVTTVTVNGANKEQVGHFAARIRDVRPPEPYKGKGIRYKDEEVQRKAGKAMAGTE